MIRCSLAHITPRILIILVLVAIRSIAVADMYCSYECKAIDEGAYNIHDLLSDKFTDERLKRKANFYRDKLGTIEKGRATKSGDIAWQNDYAVTIYELGQRDEAKAIWQKQIQDNANCIEALGNLATAAEREGNFKLAQSCAQRIVSSRPNLRAGAEQYRLAKLNYLVNTTGSIRPGIPLPRFWLPEMLKAWETRPKEIGQWEKDNNFPKISIDGLVEMLIYNPKFGDGWHVLGMALEHNGQLRQASIAYTKAVKNRGSQGKALAAHATEMREYVLNKSNSGRFVSNSLWLFGTIIAIFVVRKLHSMYQNARDNIEFYKNRK